MLLSNEQNDRHATAQQKKLSGLEGHLLAYSPPLLSDISSHGGFLDRHRRIALAADSGLRWNGMERRALH